VTTIVQDQRQAPSTGGSTERDRAALSEFLQVKREKADPARFPLTGSPTRASTLRGVSQAQVAEALGMTEGWYRQIETGRKHLEQRYLEHMVELFQLTAVERAVLYRLSQGWEPDMPLTPLVVGPETRAIIDGVPFPAYASDPLWDIKYANAHLTEMFPPLKVGANVMREAMTSPLMRELLVDYRESWFRPMLGQLRERMEVLAPPPVAAGLEELVATILRESPEAAEVWNSYPNTVYVRPNGAVRPIRRNGVVENIQLGASDIEGNPMCNMIWVVPLGQASAESAPSVFGAI
jgi:transcriptional regulator with XRE-family HTH domain